MNRSYRGPLPAVFGDDHFGRLYRNAATKYFEVPLFRRDPHGDQLLWEKRGYSNSKVSASDDTLNWLRQQGVADAALNWLRQQGFA